MATEAEVEVLRELEAMENGFCDEDVPDDEWEARKSFLGQRLRALRAAAEEERRREELALAHAHAHGHAPPSQRQSQSQRTPQRPEATSTSTSTASLSSSGRNLQREREVQREARQRRDAALERQRRARDELERRRRVDDARRAQESVPQERAQEAAQKQRAQEAAQHQRAQEAVQHQQVEKRLAQKESQYNEQMQNLQSEVQRHREALEEAHNRLGECEAALVEQEEAIDEKTAELSQSEAALHSAKSEVEALKVRLHKQRQVHAGSLRKLQDVLQTTEKKLEESELDRQELEEALTGAEEALAVAEDALAQAEERLAKEQEQKEEETQQESVEEPSDPMERLRFRVKDDAVLTEVIENLHSALNESKQKCQELEEETEEWRRKYSELEKQQEQAELEKEGDDDPSSVLAMQRVMAELSSEKETLAEQLEIAQEENKRLSQNLTPSSPDSVNLMGIAAVSRDQSFQEEDSLREENEELRREVEAYRKRSRKAEEEAVPRVRRIQELEQENDKLRQSLENHRQSVQDLEDSVTKMSPKTSPTKQPLEDSDTESVTENDEEAEREAMRRRVKELERNIGHLKKRRQSFDLQNPNVEQLGEILNHAELCQSPVAQSTPSEASSNQMNWDDKEAKRMKEQIDQLKYENQRLADEVSTLKKEWKLRQSNDNDAAGNANANDNADNAKDASMAHSSTEALKKELQAAREKEEQYAKEINRLNEALKTGNGGNMNLSYSQDESILLYGYSLASASAGESTGQINGVSSKEETPDETVVTPTKEDVALPPPPPSVTPTMSPQTQEELQLLSNLEASEEKVAHLQSLLEAEMKSSVTEKDSLLQLLSCKVDALENAKKIIASLQTAQAKNLQNLRHESEQKIRSLEDERNAALELAARASTPQQVPATQTFTSMMSTVSVAAFGSCIDKNTPPSEEGSQEIRLLEDRNYELEDRVTELEERVSELEDRIAELEEELEHVDAILNESNTTVHDLETQKLSLEERLQKQQTLLSNAEEEIQNLRSEAAEGIKNFDALRNAKLIISSLEKANRTMMDEYRLKLQQQGNAPNNSTQMQNLQRQLEELRKEKEEDHSRYEAEIKKLCDEAISTACKLNAQERQIQQLRNKRQQRSSSMRKNPPPPPPKTPPRPAEMEVELPLPKECSKPHLLAVEGDDEVELINSPGLSLLDDDSDSASYDEAELVKQYMRKKGLNSITEYLEGDEASI